MVSVGQIDELMKIAKENSWSSVIISGNPPMGIVMLDRQGKAAILTEQGLSYGKAPAELSKWLAEERAWPYPIDIAREILMEVFDVEEEE